jgi:putative oligomerization/nucleic acid binding protein
MMRRRGVGIVGVAAVAHHAGNKAAQQQANADQQAAQQQAAAAPVAEAAPAAAPVDPTMAQIENLANLHTQGILSDEEFAAAKAKVLGI